METFTTPKWDNNGVSDKNLFKKKSKKVSSKQSKITIKTQIKKKKLPKTKLNTLESTPKLIKYHNIKTQKDTNVKKSKISDNLSQLNKNVQNKTQKKVLNKKDVNKQPSGNKTNEYHTLLKSRKEFMKLSLRERMMERLKSSRFRYINEELYTSEGKSAKELFKRDPKAFKAYHEGYRQQVNKWPMNPLDVIIKTIKKMPEDKIIADMGCGEAKLAQSVVQKVHSFDLQAVNDFVTECEMSNVPLEKHSVDVVVFCLSLMGTNIKDFIYEANRILKIGGTLKIAEVQSRFEKVEVFIKGIEQFGFKYVWKDLSRELFYFIDFKKASDCKVKSKLPGVSLLPCLYKKR